MSARPHVTQALTTAASLAAAASSPALADLMVPVPTFRDAACNADASSDAKTDSDYAFDASFDTKPFDVMLKATAGVAGGTSVALADQDSSATGTSISAVGAIDVSAAVRSDAFVTANGDASTRFSMELEVLRPALYVLTVVLEEQGTASVDFELWGTTGAILVDPPLNGGTFRTVQAGGLDAGLHSLFVDLAGFAAADSTRSVDGHGSFAVSLVLTEVGVADLDGDGLVGFSDLLLLLGAWGPCPSCPEDLDGSGDVGFADLLLLLSAWH